MRRVRSALAWVPALLLVPAAMAASIQLTESDDATNPLLEIQPLDLGTTWVYDVFDHGKPSGTHTKQITGRAAAQFDRLDGVSMVGRYTDYPGRGEYSNVLYLSVDDRTMYQDGLRQDGDYLALDPGAPSYQLPLDEGESWSYDGSFGTAKLRFEATIEDVVSVEVGGREFDDCLYVVTEMEFEFEGGGGDPETLEEWTCPGYGAVRTVDTLPAQDVEITEELVEFHGESGDWFADDPEAVAARSQAGDTDGFDAGRTRAVPDGELADTLAWSDLRSQDIAYPPVSDGEVMALGEEDGSVTGVDLTAGELRWQVQVPKPVVAPLAVAAGAVLVADGRKGLWALDAQDGSARWVHHFDDVVSASPAVSGATVVVVTDDGVVSALDLSSGRVLWEHDLGVRSRSAPALADGLVVVPDEAGSVTALDVQDGSERWSRTLDGTLVAGPAATAEGVFVADDGNVVYELSPADGDVVWETRTNHDVAGDFAVSDEAVSLLAGTDRIESFDLDDGDKRWSREVPETEQSPVAVGDEVVSVSSAGRLTVLAAEDGSTNRSWALPRTAAADRLNVDVPLGLVAGSLVVGAEVLADGQVTGLFAYPVSAEAERNGVSWGSEAWVMPTYINSMPTLAGDALLVVGSDGTLHRTTRTGDTTLARTKGLLPGVVVRDDLAVAQIDDEFRGWSVAGGDDPLWKFPAQAPSPGALPAIGADTVFLPEAGVGLAAVGLDGSPRWFTPLDNMLGSSSPLALPGDDVFYGGGEAARFDGDTGDQLWSIPGAYTFSPAAYSDGAIFADLVYDSRPSGLAAIDARTGEIRWLHENAALQVFVGPAAGNGVVVYGDSLGLVVALDAGTGRELWRVRLSTPLAGTPVVVGDRVFLAESGRNEDVFQRDYRVSAHDLHTGEFLGAYQPTVMTVTGASAFTGTGDGRLLVPTIGNNESLVIVLEPRS